MSRWPARIALALVSLALGSLAWVYAAANTVPASKAGQHSKAVTVNDLKPTYCAALTLTTIVSGSGGTIMGTTGNDLILGSTVAETIQGRGGNDCILGGGGDDTLQGNAGTDVCIGGNGTDSLPATCETQVADG